MIEAVSINLPLILAALFQFVLPAGPYEFDFDQPHGTFISVLPYFTRFFYAIVVLGIAGAAIGWGSAPVLLLLLAAADALLFNIFLIFFYEAYLHARYPRNGDLSRSNYTLRRYSWILALGASAVALLFTGSAWLGWSMSRL